MPNFRKILLFVAGLFIVPTIFALLLSYFGKYDYHQSEAFFGLCYLFIYIFFPLIHNGKIAKYFTDKYILYIVLYVLALILYFILM
ncbi:MAG: hypothetical protein IJ689_05925 [Alphaproteobacteria bacterium]|nr:hypothetical protein [Alphaproteobacteria bacterium]